MSEVPLPKDHEGREIPLGTKVLYDEEGNELCVKVVEFRPFSKEWSFAVQKGQKGPSGRPTVYRRPRYVYLEKPALPDSWEKLEEDLDRALSIPDPDTYASVVCGYFDSANVDCEVCESMHGINGETCNDDAWRDIAARIRKLRGEGK